MKKIIFFSKNLCIGGMEKALISLLNNIDIQEYDITLVLEKKEGVLLKELNNNIKVIDYKLSNNKNIIIRKIINLAKKTKFIIKNYMKFDAAVSYATYSILGSQLARKCSANSVIYIHSDYYNVYDKKEEIKQFMKSISLNKFKKIIFISKNARDNLIKVLPEIEKKSEVIGNLTDYKNIKIKANEYIPNVETQKINILFLGRLEEESKQISRLILANNKNINKDKYNIIIVGDGPNKDLYLKINESSNLKFIGEMENPYPYIKECNYIILTSKFEGFPMVYNEATVLKTKIITTIPTEDEDIKYNEENVILLNKDLSNFNEVINNILTNNYKTKKNEIDFEIINSNKLKRFYKMIE